MKSKEYEKARKGRLKEGRLLLKEKTRLESAQYKREKFTYSKEQKEKKERTKRLAPYKKFLKKRVAVPHMPSAWKKRMNVRFAPPTENSSYLHGRYLNNPSDKPMLGWNTQEGRN